MNADARRVPTQSPKDTRDVELRLDWKTAVALRQVLQHIGGHPKDTARGRTDRIAKALDRVGFRPLDGDRPALELPGPGVHFVRDVTEEDYV